MTQSIVRFRVDLTIADGKVDAVESIARATVSETQNEPGTLSYDWFLSQDRKRCRIIEVFADPKAVLAHLMGPVVQELVPKILEVSQLNSLEVYGDPGTEASEILAGFGAETFTSWLGITR